MRTLTSTLLAAQRSTSAAPYLKVELHDRDVGVARLRWQRWYTGAEPDGPCAVATPADGSLLRARIDPSTGTMSHQRVASPGPGSTYSSWTNLGTVAVTPRLALAAAGTRALLAFVNAAGTGVQVRESTDSGASFGGSTTLVVAGSAVTAIACTLQSDGTAAVFYAAGGTVYRVTRSGTGAWSGATAWTNSLASVSGLAAYFEADHNVLVSGVDAAGAAGVWATVFGAGGQLPANTWTALAEVVAASAGTDVSYLATGVARAEVPRAVLVEAYSGGGAYERVHLASAAESTPYSDSAWREPQPFEVASEYGLGLAADADDAWLAAPNGVWHATSNVTPLDLTSDVLEADVHQSWDRGRLRLVLRNDDGRYNASEAPLPLAAGGELRVSPGYTTTAGDEASEDMRFWVASVRRRRARGASVVEVDAVDGWGVLAAWVAPRQLVWTAGSTSVFDIVLGLLRRAGLRLSLSPGSNESALHEPTFTVRAGDSATAVRRLLDTVPDMIRMTGTTPLLFEPTPEDATDYEYGTTHPLHQVRIEDGRTSAGWSRVFGNAVFAEAVDVAALRDGAGTALVVDDNLAAQTRADVRATTVLRRQQLAVPRGEVVTPPNVGQEVGDVVEVTDSTLGLEAEPFRVAALRLRYARGPSREGRPLYEMTLSLISV
jgi:hypothetical protein